MHQSCFASEEAQTLGCLTFFIFLHWLCIFGWCTITFLRVLRGHFPPLSQYISSLIPTLLTDLHSLFLPLLACPTHSLASCFQHLFSLPLYSLSPWISLCTEEIRVENDTGKSWYPLPTLFLRPRITSRESFPLATESGQQKESSSYLLSFLSPSWNYRSSCDWSKGEPRAQGREALLFCQLWSGCAAHMQGPGLGGNSSPSPPQWCVTRRRQ